MSPALQTDRRLGELDVRVHPEQGARRRDGLDVPAPAHQRRGVARARDGDGRPVGVDGQQPVGDGGEPVWRRARIAQHRAVDPVQHLRRPVAVVDLGPQRVADQRRPRRGLGALPAHVGHHHAPGAGRAARDDVVQVPAHMQAGPVVGLRPVAGGHAHPGHGRENSREQRILQRLRDSTLLLVEPGVVQGDGRDTRQLRGEGEVDLVEPLPGLGLYQRQRAEAAAAHEQRHHHRRAQPDRPDEPQVLLVHRRVDEKRVRDLGEERRPTRAADLDGPTQRVPVGRVALLQPGDERDLGRIGVGDRHLVDPAPAHQVHHAPVGDVRDGEVRESLQALLDRQGRLHQPARAGEERHPVELALGVGARGLLGGQESDAVERLGAQGGCRQQVLALVRAERARCQEAEHDRAQIPVLHAQGQAGGRLEPARRPDRGHLGVAATATARRPPATPACRRAPHPTAGAPSSAPRG